jgi:hypothetical protein
MKAFLSVAVIAAWLLGPVQASAKTAWVANTGDEETQIWCRYPSEAEWREDTAEDWATVVWKEADVVELSLSSGDPSGDWMVHDNYVFRGGEAVQLNRVYNTFFFGEISLEEDWSFEANGWQRTRRALFGLGNKKPQADNGTIKNPMEKYRRLSALPFYPLLASEAVAKKTCLPS